MTNGRSKFLPNLAKVTDVASWRAIHNKSTQETLQPLTILVLFYFKGTHFAKKNIN